MRVNGWIVIIYSPSLYVREKFKLYSFWNMREITEHFWWCSWQGFICWQIIRQFDSPATSKPKRNDRFANDISCYIFPNHNLRIWLKFITDHRLTFLRFLFDGMMHQVITPSNVAQHLRSLNSLRPRQNDDIFTCISWMKMYQLRLQFLWSLFLRVQLTIFQHWIR